MEIDQSYLNLFDELIIAWSFFIERMDIKIKKKEIKKYISPGSVIEISKDLSSNKFINPNIRAKNKNLNMFIWEDGFLNKKILIKIMIAEISAKK